LKVVIVHDWLVTNAGAEKVLKAILELYPEADIFSLVDFLNDEDRQEILNGKFAQTSFIQKLPFAKKHFRNYLPLFPMAIESLDLSKYDLIISSSWAFAKGVQKSENQFHISYCHTPIRYAWDLYNEYISDLSGIKKILVKWTLKRLQKWDIKTLNRVNFFIANSKFVHERIKRTYNKNAKVIYPPVDVEKFTLWNKKDDFYLTASRLVPYKRTKLIVEAFNEMPDKKLIVIGQGEEYEEIKKIKKENIQLLGYQDDDNLKNYMQKASAFVYAAIEDFGIMPVEAMATGTPVIALNNGGTAETVINGVNGIHFQNQAVEDICDAVKKFETLEFDYKQISTLTQSYNKDRFQQELVKYIYENR